MHVHVHKLTWAHKIHSLLTSRSLMNANNPSRSQPGHFFSTRGEWSSMSSLPFERILCASVLLLCLARRRSSSSGLCVYSCWFLGSLLPDGNGMPAAGLILPLPAFQSVRRMCRTDWCLCAQVSHCALVGLPQPCYSVSDDQTCTQTSSYIVVAYLLI